MMMTKENDFLVVLMALVVLLVKPVNGPPGLFSPRAENAKINVTDEPYFGTQIVCNYLPFSKAAKGAQGGPQQYATFVFCNFHFSVGECFRSKVAYCWRPPCAPLAALEKGR